MSSLLHNRSMVRFIVFFLFFAPWLMFSLISLFFVYCHYIPYYIMLCILYVDISVHIYLFTNCAFVMLMQWPITHLYQWFLIYPESRTISLTPKYCHVDRISKPFGLIAHHNKKTAYGSLSNLLSTTTHHMHNAHVTIRFGATAVIFTYQTHVENLFFVCCVCDMCQEKSSIDRFEWHSNLFQLQLSLGEAVGATLTTLFWILFFSYCVSYVENCSRRESISNQSRLFFSRNDFSWYRCIWIYEPNPIVVL